MLLRSVPPRWGARLSAFSPRPGRRQVAQGGRLWVGSFDDSLASAVDAGLDAVAVSGLLGQMRYNPVFTAHPTEAKSRTVMEALRRIFVLNERLEEGEDPDVIAAIGRYHEADGSGRLGAPGRTTFTFRSQQPGNATIHFAYGRPAADGPPPSRTVMFRVTVR